MKFRLLLLLVLGLVFGGAVSGNVAAKPKPERSHIPVIARLLGVRVGWNGQDALQRKLGKGRQTVSGHPNGHQSWRSRSPEGVIETDGFNINREGLVIEMLVWDCDVQRNKEERARMNSFPRTRKLSRRSGWLGVVYPGMTKQEVARLTQRKLPPPVKEGNTWTWRAKGFVRPLLAQGLDAYRKWTATLEFVHGRLTSISIICE